MRWIYYSCQSNEGQHASLRIEMGNPNKRIATAILVVILITGLFMAACAKPAPATISRDQALFMIIERVQNLAQTYEAKEYVAVFLSMPTTQREYEANNRCWIRLVVLMLI